MGEARILFFGCKRSYHAFGEAIDVPFISWRLLRVQVGTGAMAPPGAETLTCRTHKVQ